MQSSFNLMVKNIFLMVGRFSHFPCEMAPENLTVLNAIVISKTTTNEPCVCEYSAKRYYRRWQVSKKIKRSKEATTKYSGSISTWHKQCFQHILHLRQLDNYNSSNDPTTLSYTLPFPYREREHIKLNVSYSHPHSFLILYSRQDLATLYSISFASFPNLIGFIIWFSSSFFSVQIIRD